MIFRAGAWLCQRCGETVRKEDAVQEPKLVSKSDGDIIIAQPLDDDKTISDVPRGYVLVREEDVWR